MDQQGAWKTEAACQCVLGIGFAEKVGVVCPTQAFG